MAGHFCLRSCGVGCRAVLSGCGCGLLEVSGVDRRVCEVCAMRVAVGPGESRGAGVLFLLREGCDVNGLIPSRLT